MEGITIPNIITTLAGTTIAPTTIAPTTITIIIVGIIGGAIGGIGIDRRRRSGATASEGDAAKRQLAQLFQSEGLGQANHWSTAIATRESIPAIRTDIEEASKPFRENRREHGLVRSGLRTALRAIQPGQSNANSLRR